MALLLILLQVTGSSFAYHDFPAVASRDSGGPDAYGYRWYDSDGTGGPTFNWIDISGAGTEVTGLGDDNVVGPFSVGFDFPYYWYTVNSFYVGSNGYIAFGDNTMRGHPFPGIPTTGRPNNMLAPMMSDLDPADIASDPHVYYWTNAATDTFIISYENVRFWNAPTSLNTFQIVLALIDSTITFQYLTQQGIPSSGWASGGLTVGIENIAGTVGLQYNHNNQPTAQQLHDSLTVLFVPPESTTYEAHDVAVSKMMNEISGGFFVYKDSTIDLWGVVQNTGNQTEGPFDVYCEVKTAAAVTVLTDTLTVGMLAPGETDSLVFSPAFSSSDIGKYSLMVKTLLAGDQVAPNDSIYVEFRVVEYPAELLYDQGFASTGFAWNGDSSGYGAKFTPPIYPTRVDVARFYIYDAGAFPDVVVKVLDDDGPNNSPGTELFDTTITINHTEWWDIDVTAHNIQITDGSFYVGCISLWASEPSFGMDTLFPSGRQSWEYTGVWAPYRDKETDDVLMRAIVSSDVGVKEYELGSHEQIGITATPNPFSTMTAITVAPTCKDVAIYDASGRLVRNLQVDNGRAQWNGYDNHGKKLNQGIYFGVTDGNKVRKIIFVK